MFSGFPFKHELIHFLAGLPFVFFLLRRFKKWWIAIALYLSVFLVDFDHWVDYFLWTQVKGANFWQNPLATRFFETADKIYVPLHAWEIVLILLILAWRFKKVIFLAVALGLFSHLVVDQLSYQTHVFSYSLIYRIFVGFSHFSFNHLTL